LYPKLIVITLFAVGCGTGPPKKPEPPPLVCKTPGPTPAAWFTDATAEFGLTPAALGTSIRAADLDGDGFPDVISAIGHLAHRETAAMRMRFVLMNRPDPADPARRILVDTTAESGLLATRDGAGGRGFSNANLGDLDNDGDLDVIACPGVADANTVDPCVAFLNDGSGHFQLGPVSQLEGEVFQSASGAFVDLDRDGLLDFWPAAFGTQPYVFRGGGDGHFTDIAPAAGLPTRDGPAATHESYRRTFGVTACDIDDDGDADVLLADYGREANQLWRNDGGLTFTNVALERGVAFDDRMDYTDDLSYQCYCKSLPGTCPATVPVPADCSFTRGWFPGQSDQPWRLGGNDFSIACGDLDDDGDLDLMTATIRHGDVGSASDPSELLYNPGDGGRFVRPGNVATGIDRPHTGIGWNEGDMMPVLADLDLDGRKDLYLTSSDYPGNHGWLWHGKPDGTFEDVTVASGGGHKQIHGVALVDLDGDGDLDLIAGTSTARGVAPSNALFVYRNTVGQDANWTQLRLVGGPGSNRSAIGARVRVTAGGRTQTQEVSGGYGHNSLQNDLVLTFGLGSACAIERIEVRWPDAAGTVTRYDNPRANYRLEIRQAEPDVIYPR
jgi:enediyne biosynthesis protein E4